MPNPKNSLDYSTYLWTTGLSIVVLLTAIVSFNYVVDPYLIHQWDTPAIKRLVPADQKVVPWGKTYAVSRYQPEVVYLGSSRVQTGLPVQTDLFKGKRVFNLSVAGGTLGDAMAMLQHTSFFKRPDVIVWGLDYGWLSHDGIGNTDFDRDLVADSPNYALWRTLINLKRSASIDITLEAVKWVLGLSEQQCETILSFYGQKPEPCVAQDMIDEGGARKNFEILMKEKKPGTYPKHQSFLQKLDTVIADQCRHGAVLRFFIQPVHALDELYTAPSWQAMENWKRDVVTTISHHQPSGCDIRLIDFSGFNSITTEAIPQETGRDEMQYYWESSHYKSEVGGMMLTKLFSSKQHGLESDFGVDLTPETIEAHLAKVRRDRDKYCITHPKETALFQACKNGNGV